MTPSRLVVVSLRRAPRLAPAALLALALAASACGGSEPSAASPAAPPGIYRVVEEGDEAELLHLAEVVIAETMQEGKKVNHFVPGTKLRLQYEW